MSILGMIDDNIVESFNNEIIQVLGFIKREDKFGIKDIINECVLPDMLVDIINELTHKYEIQRESNKKK